MERPDPSESTATNEEAAEREGTSEPLEYVTLVLANSNVIRYKSTEANLLETEQRFIATGHWYGNSGTGRVGVPSHALVFYTMSSAAQLARDKADQEARKVEEAARQRLAGQGGVRAR